MELLSLEAEKAYLSLQHQNHSSYLRNITHWENSMSGLYVPWHCFCHQFSLQNLDPFCVIITNDDK
jgi:hypothetical protein